MYIIIILLFLHFVGDFIFQSDKIAINKSESIKLLTLHCYVYMSLFYFCFTWSKMFYNGTIFLLLIFISHFIIDFITSRITKKFFNEGKRYKFFITIGFDQFLHLSILLILNNVLL